MDLPSPSAAFPTMPGGSPSAIAPPPSGESGVVFSGSMNWEPVRQRLLGTDMKDALLAATELREGIEIVHTTEFPLMLSALLPAFSSILAHRTNPSPDTSTVEHKLRNVVLEIISRLPSNEVLRPHAPHLVAVALDILNRDFEDNSLLASRIIFDLYKVYRSLPQDYVQPYLDFVQTAYRALPSAVQRNFLFPALAAGPSPGSERKGSISSELTSLDGTDVTPGKQLATPTGKTPATTTTTTPGDKDPKTPAATSLTPPGLGTPMAGIPTSPVPRLSLRSNSSFRVLTECPLIVMLMFQLYPKFLKTNIPVLINVMMEALALRAPPMQSITQGNQTLDSNGQRLYFSRCRELVAAQAKTLSFLTYLLRGFSNELKPYEDRLASNVVALMSTCPREFISTRKELLVATRHLLNSDFRNGFFRHVDALLDERVLIGSHHRYSDQTILRPLGYTTLSDLVHHVRSLLTMTQMSRVVGMFSRVLHDSSMTLPMSTQYTAVRTLLSVVDIVFHNKDTNPQIGRDILVRILKTLVDKLSTLKDYYPLEVKGTGGGKTVESTSDKGSYVDAMEIDEAEGSLALSHEEAMIKLELPAGTDPAEAIKDLKSMVRAIIVGHKTVIWYINNYRAQREKEKIENTPPPVGANEEVASAMLKMTHSERDLIDNYIVLALPCIKLLNEGGDPTKPSDKPSTSDQYRDALTYFAAAFTTLDGPDLRRTLGRRLELVVEAIVDEPTVMVIPRHLLGSNATTSFEFCSLLLDFLVERMEELATSRPPNTRFISAPSGRDYNEVERLKKLTQEISKRPEETEEERTKRSTTYLQLFERVLKSLSVYPENEKALRPHLKRIVSTCLRSSMEKSDFQSDNYCMLLRYVFRSISAGKFEDSYRELLPLIPTVLNGMYRIVRATDDAVHHYTAIELFLTIPARLSSLLPHMNLLLRIIIRALQSSSGDLVNLGLRTLEFWVDNLNPEFLYPELSKQSDLFIQLMRALSTHLRPAPYPYGLLTLRLLGKLGGKNRRVLREPMDVCEPRKFEEAASHFLVECSWAIPDNGVAASEGNADGVPALDEEAAASESFPLPLPLERCVEMLKLVASSYKSETSTKLESSKKDAPAVEFTWKESKKLWDAQIEKIDLLPYCMDVVEQTKRSQAEAALIVLRSTLVLLIDVEKCDLDEIDISGIGNIDEGSESHNAVEMDSSIGLETASSDAKSHSSQLQNIGRGLMFGCCIDSVRDEAMALLKGLYTHLLLVVMSYQKSLVRIDANGSAIVHQSSAEEGKESTDSQLDLFEGELGALKPFGYFDQAGPLRHKADPMTLNSSLAQFLTESSQRSIKVGLEILKFVLDLPQRLRPKVDDSDGGQSQTRPHFAGLDRGSLMFLENMLSKLCEQCISTDWNRREGIYEGICAIVERLGPEWSRKYEIELMNVALFSVKSAPREMSAAAIRAFQFLVQVCSGLYGIPKLQASGEGSLVWDILAVTGDKDEPTRPPDKKTDSPATSNDPVFRPSEEVLHILITEMASTKQIVRIASRYVLKHFIIDSSSREECKELFQNQLTLIRRVLFSRSLRLLPLPEQVGAVEALAVIIDQMPEVIPLTDQHLLAFLSELLKMSSVADGEMSDSNLVGHVVDKNGFAVSVEDDIPSGKDQNSYVCSSHASSIFLRRECIVNAHNAKIVVAEELPFGVQLRVSSICLLRSVIRGQPDPFFDAEASTPVGNIRPHVISLLFRSLVSCPMKAVVAAHDALRDVLTLSVAMKEGPEGTKSRSRLPKELLQTCIRPVLLNLRDYTRLSVSLLRGLSRLLSLLSSWFNKTLGEKLLDHLQKWTDPGRIKSHKIWAEGEEPQVAAAIVDLFALLPHASHFVEPLVKTVIKLEACLPAFKSSCVSSPYRKPLARYLNKHCQHTMSFFFQRLRSPLYTELFQDIIKLEESQALREYLSGKQCSTSILNVCFERPLAIIRSEKTSGSSSAGMTSPKASSGMTTAELFAIHGIQQKQSPQDQKEALLRKELEGKKAKLQILQQEFSRTKEAVQAKASTATATPSADGQVALEESKRQHKAAKAAYDKGAKDFNETKQRYVAEMARANAQKNAKKGDAGATRPMNIESLELQHQGFRIVDTLMANDENYLKNHNDVLRAFRWLWRSKGRSLRLQYEESVAPRYHGESKMLASFLVDYSRNFPNDVDVLFELIRIFLQSTTNDFSFVKTFLMDAVSDKLSVDQKKHIIQRFFALLAGESTEETKTLSIQLVVLPMLRATFEKASPEKMSTKIVKQPDEQPGSDDSKTPGCAEKEISCVDAVVVRKFVKEVLFKEGKPIACGDRLRVELLRISNLLLEHVPDLLEEFRRDMVKFCWSLLKSDDTSCKNWAYLVVSRFISVFETPVKIIHQVYIALLRAHQQEGKDLVRAALELLVPALPKRLQEEDFRKVIEYTNRIMFEEGNSIPQLAHIWHTIVHNSEVFYPRRHQFVRYMINSLNRLGLPPNCPPENRALSVSIVELVMKWDDLQSSTDASVATPEEAVGGAKRKAGDAQEAEAGADHPDKKRKVTSGAVSVASKSSDESIFVLDQSMSDTVANFLVRLKVLIADTKVDAGTANIDARLTALFRKVASRWRRCVIRPVYFEKVVSMCKEDNSSQTSGIKGTEKSRGKASDKTASKSSTIAGGQNSSSTSKKDTDVVTSPLLSACLDIFIVLVEEAPENVFLGENSLQLKEVLETCFNYARQSDEDVLRRKLRRFVVQFLTASKEKPRSEGNIMLHVNVLVEKLLLDAEKEQRKSVGSGHSSSEPNRQGGSRSKTAAPEQDEEKFCISTFALEIIEEVCQTRVAYFKAFSSALLGLATTLVKKHTTAASAKQKQSGATYVPQAGASSFRQMYHTPVEGIIGESCSSDISQPTATGISKSTNSRDPHPSKELSEFDQTLRSAVIILQILGDSDLPFSFTQDRKTLFQIISSILDSSNSVQLLMAAVRIVGKWLLSDLSGGPLTVKERNSFLWKIASFDFNGLPDVVSQPLADLVAHSVISFLNLRGLGTPAGARGSEQNNSTAGGISHSSITPQRASDNDDMIMGRSLMACLLTSNFDLREELLSLYASQNDDAVKKQGGEKMEVERDSQGPRQIPQRGPFEVLWHLFHSDFEGLGGRFWIVLFVEQLLASIQPNQNEERVKWLPRPKTTLVKTVFADPSLKDDYSNFCDSLIREKSDFTGGGFRLITALRKLAHGDIVICQQLFETLLPAGWEKIRSDGLRLKLVPAIESLLSRPFHSQFLRESDRRRQEPRAMNVIRAFLNGISKLTPLPSLDVDLLVSLGENYNCWYEVLSLLEQQHLVLSSNDITSEGVAMRDKTFLAMRHCYRQLGETDIWMSLAVKSCDLSETKLAVSLDIHGKVNEALDAYTNLVELVESGEKSPSDFEMDMLEERWVELNREQCQLQVVSEYAQSCENPRLLLECAWKDQKWDKVRTLASSSSLVAAVEAGDPAVKMSETLLAVADGKLSDVENLHAQTAQLCLYKWQLLPELSSGSLSHASLLHFFHRLVEIRESGQIMVETSNHSNGKTLPDLKNLLNAWRHRLPNDYEDMTIWDEVFTWRTHMFSAITSNFHWSEPSTLATLHDRPWTAIRMATTARKQGMRETALLLLNKLTGSSSMDVSDAYLKLREQILAYQNPDSDLERTGGLNLINTTNLSFFDASQKSELFRLKAMFLASLGGRSKSNQAYCHSVQICPTYSRAWVSWGGLCSSLGALTEKQADQLAAKASTPTEAKESRASSAKKVAQYLAQAMGCYLEAIQIDAHEKSRIHLPKCLWILTKDGSAPGVLCQTLENRGTALPPWVWLPWIPQLLTSLCRIEGRAIKAILSRLVKAYPQAVYYSLRAFYLERRDVERSKGIPSTSGQHMGSVAYAEEMMSTLRRSHASLWSSLEAILEELIVKFRPSYEEELLATISALLERAESHSEKQSVPDKARLEDEDAMVASWSKTLSRIAAKFFRESDSSSSSNRRDERVKKTADFKRKYKADFEDDFKVTASDGQPGSSAPEPTPQFRLEEYITRLQKWKRKLEAQVACTPSSLPLIESSHSLAMFAGEVPDLWPGSCDPRQLQSQNERDPAVDGDNGTSQSSTSSSAAAARKAANAAALAAAKAAAKEGVGGEYGGGAAAIEIPGQYCPNAGGSADVKPNPELHAKLIRFEPFVEVLRRNDQLVRRAGMVGSDGRTYRFLLQFAIPYWTRTDERTAQTHYIVDKFLRQNVMTARKHLSIQPNAAIPVAQRLRMTLDVDSRISLEEVYRKSFESSKNKYECIPTYFLGEITRRLKEKYSTESTELEKTAAEMSTRLEVYGDICGEKVDNSILLRHIQSILDGPEPLFQFRRAFAGQLAANSLLQYVFSAAERTPARFVMIQSNARILSPDFRVSYSNQGFIEAHDTPFRMTPNVVALIGQPHIDGRFIPSFAAVSGAIRENKDEFDSILRLLMRDDILAWYSKSLAKSDSKTQELERQLIERVSKNVTTLQSRFAECAPRKIQSGASDTDPVDKKVRELYAAATNPEKLCMMPTSYHSWL